MTNRRTKQNDGEEAEQQQRGHIAMTERRTKHNNRE